ncbi:MAG: FAD-dependent thymidylate synthase [Candidatus Delongbacteria bacterium]|nr:FAD-dependent thymidylate synthase [Candidatus Delongbacteria bacterium]MCG2760999.1 FAD-dependent thymidylate synthase [Candidatus Delongbacteria bacterium]
MKVLLSGYNLDSSIIEELKKRSGWKEDNITPETLSAAYARISRDPRDIEELRKEARKEVEKSRKSNELIIFGLGHSSVAEHAYFNFDIIGLSRFAVEQVQKFRLASFTEKSQRYITLEDDFVIPKEIKDAGFEDKFVKLIKLQNENYHIICKALQEYLFDKHADMIKKKNGRRTVEGWAKEDARYVVSMATESQFGMSINARSLENVLRQLGNSELAECRELASKLYNLVKDISPSIIKYIEPTKYDRLNEAELNIFIAELPDKDFQEDISEVKLVDHTLNPDKKIASVIISAIKNISLSKAEEIVNSLSESSLKNLFLQALKYRMSYDSVKRYFEFTDATFELTISSSNYAQLKRHRMASIITNPYDISLGYTLPPNVDKVGMRDKFIQVMQATEQLYSETGTVLPYHSQYILTNAHRRKLLMKMNFRELYHFMSLRLDEHAQWDIRNTAELMLKELEKVAPLSTLMCCGKSDFTNKTKLIFGNN